MTSSVGDDDEALLLSVAMQNANSILLARQRGEHALALKTEELALSLAMMRATLESTTDGILVTDGAGTVTDYNEKYVEMWRLPRDAMKTTEHRKLLELIADQFKDRHAFLERVEAINRDAPAESFDLLDFKDGRAFERFTKIQFLEGRSVGRVWCLRDVTERKLAEQQRQILLERTEAARRDAEAANRAKDEFLAVVSHELRTPLNAITGWATLLLAGNMSAEKRQHAVEVINRNAKAQGKIIEDLLDVSRIVSGKVRLSVDPIEPGDCVEMAIEAVRPAAHAKDIELRVTLDPDAGTVMGDRDRLQQILWNLLTNAVKFTPRGGKICVRVRRQDSSAQIVVEDTGQGIASDFMPYVFERFRQADASFTRSKGGLGLGLAIVRHLVELHGGTIKVESEGEGRGATFTLSLPVASLRRRAPSLPSLAPEAALPVTTIAYPPELAGIRVLIVDDDPDGREMLRAMLEHGRAVVTLATSAAEALELLKQTRPDVLVSDIGMPGEDGYTLIRNVRALAGADGGQTPAVALTAYAQQKDRTKALSAGFDMHVPKPVDPSELSIVIVNLFVRHRRVD